MDVGFVNRMLGFTRGGGEIWDLRIAERLQDLGVDVTFYIAKPLRSDVPSPVGDFRTVEVDTPHLRDIAYASPRGIGGMIEEIDSRLFIGRMATTLKSTPHDLVNVNSDPRFGRIVPELDTPMTIKMNGLPHSFWHETMNPFSSSYEFFARFDAVIGTGVVPEEIRKRTGHDSVFTVNPGVDTSEFTPGTDRDRSSPVRILYVGRFVPVKRLTLLVEAFAELRERHPDTELILVGDGPRRSRITALIDSLELNDSVTLPGYVPNAEVTAYYQRADVFVLSSRSENHPITVLEAMSSGLPVVAPEVGWLPEMVEHGETGFLYPVSSTAALVDSLATLVENPTKRSRFGDRGRELVVSAHDWKERAREVKRIFESVVDRND